MLKVLVKAGLSFRLSLKIRFILGVRAYRPVLFLSLIFQHQLPHTKCCVLGTKPKGNDEQSSEMFEVSVNVFLVYCFMLADVQG